MTTTTYVMGIDGGGTHVRVVICTPELKVVAESDGRSVNPNAVGKDTAARELRRVIREALLKAGILPAAVASVGAGIAGTHALQGWLEETLTPIFPKARILTTLDLEIALVGAFGERNGVIIVSGTGSAAYGVNAVGETALVGGWGYLLGDEGSGYWIGTQLLRDYARMLDGNSKPRTWHMELASQIGGSTREYVVEWRYSRAQVSDVAALATIAMENEQESICAAILDSAAAHLGKATLSVVEQLRLPADRIAFAGGLISTATPLSERLRAFLKLPTFPAARYPAAIGAVLLAREYV